MKKILVSMFLLVFGLCLVGCTWRTGPDITNGGGFNVNYDYGNIEENKITILIDNCLPFFDFDDYNIEQLYPGDTLYIDYTGKPVIEESYPGRMTGIEVNHVELYRRTIREISEEEIVRNESNGISNVYNYSYTTEYVILNEELDYVPLSEYTGTTLYVSEDCASNGNSKESKSGDPKPIPIAAFFAFNPNEEKTYNLNIQNDSSNELIGIKEEYKAGEEVEVKMEYDMAVETYVFLNGELLGTLNGSNSLKFNMPDKDSTLVLTYTNAEIYKVNVIDNFNLLRKPLKSYYIPGEEVEVILQFLSGPRVGIVLNGNKIETTGELVEGLGELFTFTMPNTDSVIYITYNDIICNPDNDEHHKWDEGKHQQVPGGGHDELIYTCEYCGHHKYVEFTYEMQIEELATIVENELKTLNTEKIIIKDLIKMLEDIFVEYDLTDTQIKEIEVCVSVLEKLDEFDEITKEELEELYKNPDISDNME